MAKKGLDKETEELLVRCMAQCTDPMNLIYGRISRISNYSDIIIQEDFEAYLYNRIKTLKFLVRYLELFVLQSKVNRFANAWTNIHENEDYEDKKSFVIQINKILREGDAAIRHPETQQPSMLLALNSWRGVGRYTLEDRVTKKRQGSYKTVSELFPVSLIDDVQRKEGIIERREKPSDGGLKEL
jgi:hypothetical protein